MKRVGIIYVHNFNDSRKISFLLNDIGTIKKYKYYYYFDIRNLKFRRYFANFYIV